RGTLMADLLRAARALPGFIDALGVHFVEASPALRAAQRERVPDAIWHDDLSALPRDRPLLVVANEFFDALPVRQEVRVDGVWRERTVGIADERFVFLPDGDAIRETAPVRVDHTTALAARVAAQGGAALIFDYGYEGPAEGDTLQAM